MEEERLKRLGSYIRALREAQGLSQEELAKKSGFAGRAAISDLALSLGTAPGELMDVLIETDEKSFTHGLNAENLARLKSYADYLRSTQE